MLQQRIQSYRAYRTERYDVYLPSSLFSTTSSSSSNISTASSLLSTTSNNNKNTNRIGQRQQRRQQQQQQPQQVQQQQYQHQHQHQGAFFLILGVTVSHEAYSDMACWLLNDGIVVTIFSLEPLCLSHHQLGTDATIMIQMIQYITTTLTTATTNRISQQQQHW